MIEDREPDAAMAALWRTPEVTAILRRNHIHFSRRPVSAKKVISPPMIVEIKNATVADILDVSPPVIARTRPKCGFTASAMTKKQRWWTCR